MQASSTGQDFIFEDSDEDTPIWDFEDRLAGDEAARDAAGPGLEPKGVLDASMADVLSAYSSEQGMFHPMDAIGDAHDEMYWCYRNI